MLVPDVVLFSGITLLGFGIGLPANYLLEVPHSAFTVTRRGALDVARAGLLLGKRSRAGDGLSDIIPHMSDIEQSPCTSSSGFKIGSWTENIVDLADFKSCFQKCNETFGIMAINDSKFMFSLDKQVTYLRFKEMTAAAWRFEDNFIETDSMA
ncbi:UNVERIFIED_CONTAM: hypothetical protein Sangu_1851100 [Sesamum angustifolium]|uniref:Uncharacterized protein n=1 Tax=Sesamum angustifolium TaxID=2727405 RepID=A0AAW2MC92_9LAMI